MCLGLCTNFLVAIDIKKWNFYVSANYAISEKQRCAIIENAIYAKIFHTANVFICA